MMRWFAGVALGAVACGLGASVGVRAAGVAYVENSGLVFGLGMLGGTRGIVVVNIVVCTALAALALRRWWRPAGRLRGAALGLLIGGLASNLIEQATCGSACDYVCVQFGVWPAFSFNLADLALTTGAALLAVAIRSDRSTPNVSGSRCVK